MTAEILIDKIYQEIEEGRPVKDLHTSELEVIQNTLQRLDQGEIRIIQNHSTQTWIKKSILLFFKIKKIHTIHAGELQFNDKIPIKKYSPEQNIRIVPPAIIRYGSYIEPGCIIMPSFINVGAYIESGTMVDTWATVGSCAQIGKNVHISGGVGIGGVLEPLQAHPVIIENDVFIGSRSIIVEGAHIEAHSVIGAGVTITGSSKIIDVTGPTEKILTGRVPESSVVIPGGYSKKFPSGSYNVNCALIIGKRTPHTDSKVSLNQTLRDFEIPI